MGKGKKIKKTKGTPGPFRQQQVDKIGEAYKRQGIDVSNFPNFNQATDTIIQGQSTMHNVASSMANMNASNAAAKLNNLTGQYSADFKRPIVKDSKTYRTSSGYYSKQDVYSKEDLKNSLTNIKKQ